ncbi:hypothetical protein Dxin01_00326 [Deinococcus xinjiangensis]|uniref:Uncharacterized protein n=1 Tax=Deinococcus xinjiangensis TaxID=457454 RepID=A0ABP9V5Q1_9DEIO
MTDQRVGRHVRIYEWDEVDIESDTLPTGSDSEAADHSTKQTNLELKPKQEQAKGLSGLLKRKIF